MSIKTDRTAVIEGRTSHRYLAGVALWASKNEQPIATKGALVDLAFEALYSMLVNKHQIPAIETTEEALEILSSLGLVGMNRGNKAKGILIRRLQEDSSIDIIDFPTQLAEQRQARVTADVLAHMIRTGQLKGEGEDND